MYGITAGSEPRETCTACPRCQADRDLAGCVHPALLPVRLQYTCGSTERHRLQKVLNFCARVISGRRKRDHISDVLRDLHWMTADSLVSYHRICGVRRILESGHPEEVACTLVSAADHGHNTRHAHRLRLPRIRTEAGRRQLVYSGAEAYNQFAEACNGGAPFNPRPAGPLDFPPPAGGGGRLNAPPPMI